MTEREDILARLHEANLAEPLRERLAEYGALLLSANRRTNLTGARSPAELVPHLLDSLTLVPFLRLGQQPDGAIVDVGSGGGLPAIPLALATGTAVTLIEAAAKKARFLESVLPVLGIAGEIRGERAEQAAHRADLRARFAWATARAVSGLSTVLELTLPFLRVGGAAVLQRGPAEPGEREAAEGAALMLGAQIEAVHDLPHRRRVLIVRKVRETPGRFPRRSGVPEKRPLLVRNVSRETLSSLQSREEVR